VNAIERGRAQLRTALSDVYYAARDAARQTTTRERSVHQVLDSEVPPSFHREPMEETTSDEAPTGAGPHMLVLQAGGGIQSRGLSYRDDLFSELGDYSLTAAPWLRAAARWYPGAHFTRDAFAHIGITGEFGSVLGVTSRQRSGASFPTDSWRFDVGVDVRLPIDPVEIGLGFTYGIQTFSVGSNEDGDAAQVPNVQYQSLRPMARVRLDIGVGLYADAAFGWRFLTGVGPLSEWFPRNSGSGFDLGAGFGWESDMGLGVRLGFEMQRYFFAFHPEPGDPLIVGGAEDQYLTGTVDVVWRVR
jgi:hypothetical protein